MNRRSLLAFSALLLPQAAPRIYKPPANIAANQAPPTPQGERRAVVPLWAIQQFRLHEAQRGVLTIAGEDGRYYSLDDVLFVLFDLLGQHLQMQRRK